VPAEEVTTPPVRPLEVLRATETDRAVLEQLWTMFRHEMSAFTAALPDANGRFRQERLDSALSEPGWAGYLLRAGTTPVGFAIVRGVDSAERVISSFFLVHGARRSGHGRIAVRAITHRHPGAWAVAFQDANIAATRFWRSVAADADPRWTATHHAVPGRPELPPDSWIRFTTD
jgi:predicted acetyltransferase